MMVKVTVLSPYHNRKNAVGLTLQSIAAQDYDDYEALIWDDGSSDGTWEELQKVHAEIGNPRIRIFQHQPNIGFTAGLNYAIAHSQGEYIAIVGSGDSCRPERLSSQVRALDDDPEACFCASRSLTVDEVTGEKFEDESYDSSIIQAKDIAGACPFTHGSVMYRRTSLERAGGYDPIFTWCADWDLFFRLLGQSHARYVPDILYERYARLDGVSFSPQKSMTQIKSKYLALSLAGLSFEERERMISNVRELGLDEALSKRRSEIIRDLRSRQVKLRLMKRYSAADNLKQLIDEQYGRQLKWSVIASFAKIAGKGILNQNAAISYARRLKNACFGSGLVKTGRRF